MSKYAVAYKYNEIGIVDIVTEYIGLSDYRLRTWNSYELAKEFAIDVQSRLPRYTYWVISLGEVKE